ncbi:MAG: MAPEG family protein [Candidatus Binatia bacterium]
MSTAIMCTALLGLLVFGLGFAISLTRGSTNQVSGYTTDPTDRLYKLIRAHGNTTEFAPMLAILMIVIAMRAYSSWMLWFMWIATISRYLLAVGIIVSPTLEKPHPLRFAGALGTYVSGIVLCVAAFLVM